MSSSSPICSRRFPWLAFSLSYPFSFKVPAPARRRRPSVADPKMAISISERIAELRKEIAEIQSANRLASISPFPYQEREAMKQRRAERLQEIMADLHTLNEWKKP